MYKSVDFSIFTELWNHHHSIILEHFIIPKGNPVPISNCTPLPPSLIDFLPIYLLLFLASSSSSSVASSTFAFLCNHHPTISRTFSLSQTETLYPLNINFPLLLPPGPGNHNSTFCLYEVAHISGIMLYLSDCDWLLSVSLCSKVRPRCIMCQNFLFLKIYI